MRAAMLCRLGGLLPVWRGASGIETHLEAAAAVFAVGAHYAVMPEGGTGGPRDRFAEFRPGAALIAMRTGVPIVPYALHVDRAWRLKGWDRFTIPKPFARIQLVFGDPKYVAGDSSASAIEQAGDFERALDAAVDAAEGLAAARGEVDGRVPSDSTRA